MTTAKRICYTCGRALASPAKGCTNTAHSYQIKEWRLDKTSERYKRYLVKLSASMRRPREYNWEKADKRTPKAWLHRNIKNIQNNRVFAPRSEEVKKKISDSYKKHKITKYVKYILNI